MESGRAGLVTLSLGGLERSRKNEHSGGRLRYLDAAIEAAKRFWMGPPRAEISCITRVKYRHRPYLWFHRNTDTQACIPLRASRSQTVNTSQARCSAKYRQEDKNTTLLDGKSTTLLDIHMTSNRYSCYQTVSPYSVHTFQTEPTAHDCQPKSRSSYIS